MSHIYFPYKKSQKSKIITVDLSSAKLRDDALSIKKDGNKYIVYIHVTDAGLEIIPGSQEDLDALNNFKSLYLPRHRIHMLNPQIETKLSLDSGRLRRTFTLKVVLDDSSQIIDYDIRENQIAVCKNFSYEEADIILQKSDKNSEFYFLNDLHYISQALAKINKSKNIYWNLKDITGKVDENKSYTSYRMVSEYMVLYNRILAMNAQDKNMPYVYRGQEKEYISDLMSDFGIKKYKRTRGILNCLYLDSKYSKIPIPHAGSGYISYSHSSDPGHRYTDLYNQYLYHQFYFNDMKYFYDEKEFEELIDYFNKRNRELNLMEAEYTRALELKRNS